MPIPTFGDRAGAANEVCRTGSHAWSRWNFKSHRLSYGNNQTLRQSIPAVKIMILIGVAFSMMYATNASARTQSIEQKYNIYFKATAPSSELSSAAKVYHVAVREYTTFFAADQNELVLRNATTDDVRLLFTAAGLAAAYAPLIGSDGARFTSDMARDLAELERRHAARGPDYSEMYKRLILNRQFDAARAFYDTHNVKTLPPLPQYNDETEDPKPDTPTELVISTKEREMTRREVHIDGPSQVIVLVDPMCHFCEAFLDDMQSNPKLLRLLEKHAIWITPADSVLQFDVLQRWNRTFPNLPLAIVYRPTEWSMIKVWAVPIFYFLKHGKLITTVVGWPSGGHVTQLRAALKEIGLPEPPIH